MIDENTYFKITGMLSRIRNLASEIEKVGDNPMKGFTIPVEDMCKEIQLNCKQIEQALGTPPG